MSTRLKFDGLPEGTHTFTYDERPDGNGGFEIAAQPQVNRNDIVEVEDLNDPKSERARQCRLAIDSGKAHVIEGKASAKKDAAPKQS